MWQRQVDYAISFELSLPSVVMRFFISLIKKNSAITLVALIIIYSRRLGGLVIIIPSFFPQIFH